MAAFRHPRSTTLEPIGRAKHQSVGGVDRAHHGIQAAARALRTHIRSRTGEDIVPGHALFPWMLPHAAWSNNPFQPQSRRGGTHGSQNGHILQESSAFIHGGVHDQSTHQYSWTEEETGCTVGRLDESDGQVVLTPHGWLETSEFTPIRWEITRVDSMIQPCLKPNF